MTKDSPREKEEKNKFAVIVHLTLKDEKYRRDREWESKYIT